MWFFLKHAKGGLIVEAKDRKDLEEKIVTMTVRIQRATVMKKRGPGCYEGTKQSFIPFQDND